MGTLTLEAVLDSLRPVRPVPRGGDTKRRVRRWRLARDPAGHQIGRNGRQGCCREKLAEGGVIHRLLGIGNLPQCQLECGPLSPTTHGYRPLVHADWAGNPGAGTWAVTNMPVLD